MILPATAEHLGYKDSKAKGYIRVDQKDINGKKGYYFYKTLTEKPAFFDLQKLMMLQYARFVR